MIKKLIAIFLALTCSLTACSRPQALPPAVKPLKIITSIFAAYDFARQVGKDRADISLLLKPGSEAHSYEPSPKDIISISTCDIFICTGGENDAWIDTILEAVDNPGMQVIRMLDYAEVLEEETVDGMQEEGGLFSSEEEDEVEVEWDEHVWMDPHSAGLIAEALAAAFTAADPEGSDYYELSASSYIAQLDTLDRELKSLIEAAPRRELIFADRFPARYFTEAYGLDYYAAFPGCSDSTEASAATVSFLIRKTREDRIPVVFKIELSSGHLARTVSEETKSQVLTFYTGHNVTVDDFTAGTTFIDLMYRNLEALKLALY